MNDEKDEEMTTITVSLPVNLVERIKRVATYLYNDESWVLKLATEKYLNAHEDDFSIMYDRLEDVKHGENLISHEEARNYIDEMIENLKVQKQQREILNVGS